ncbi:MAG: penicillin-binding protein 1A [Pseudomonadota bacterium]
MAKDNFRDDKRRNLNRGRRRDEGTGAGNARFDHGDETFSDDDDYIDLADEERDDFDDYLDDDEYDDEDSSYEDDPYDDDFADLSDKKSLDRSNRNRERFGDDGKLMAAPIAAARRSDASMGRGPREESSRRNDSQSGFVVALNVVGMVFGAAVLGVIGVSAFAALYFHKLGEDLPDYDRLADYEPPVTTRVYAGDGSLVAEFARERRIFVPIEAIPDSLKQAFISAEDKNFYNHSGVDLKGIIRAQIANVSNVLNDRRLEGGSTITQQVAKNFLLSSEQKIERKLREWIISRRIEKAFTKEQILELYLNEIYLGNRSYGVAAAALNYFDKSLDELDVEEAAYLAAIPKGPSNYHPVRHRERAIERRNWVLGRLRDDGVITPEEALEAQETDLGAVIAPPLGARDWASEYFAEEVRKQIADRYGVEALYERGLSVRTTLNPDLQKAAGRILRRWLVDYDRRHGWRGPVMTIDVLDKDTGDWPDRFSALFEDSAIAQKFAEDLSPWRPAVVLEVTDQHALIGFDKENRGEIPLAELKWARKYVNADTRGAEVKSPRDVLNVGDVVFAEAITEAMMAARKQEKETGSPNARTPIDDNTSAPILSDAGIAQFMLRQVPAINGGFVAIDPHTGRVLAMVGGFSFQLSEFNRVVQARRQPGSTFKPFVYAAALDNGYSPSSIVLDAPFVAPGVDSWWKPGNYVAGRFYGESTLRLGIEQSRNTMTARLANQLGIGRIVDYANRFQLSDSLPRELAISLGSGETTLMRITAAYASFVNGGKIVSPFTIDRVQDRRGKTVFKQDQRVCATCQYDEWRGQYEPSLSDAREQIIDPRTAYQMVSMLEGVVLRGTGRRVRRVVEKPLAGKTGTTNEYKDAWFVGFAPDLAAGVYVGFDLPKTLGQGEAGGRVAAPIFADFMAEALANEPGIPFRVPSGIRLVRVNAKTGRPARAGGGNVILEAFKAEDVIGTGSLDDALALDPLSAGPGNKPSARQDEPSDGDLSGIY